MTGKTLAERVAEAIVAQHRMPYPTKRQQMDAAIAEFVLAADALDRRDGPYADVRGRYDAALAALAKALGVTE